MPSGVFKPYAGVSTAVLVFTKGESTKKVWFYQMENDGFSLDDKRTKMEDGKGDIPNIIKSFEKRKEESNKDRKKKYFIVSIEEIKEKDYNLSISTYKDYDYEEKKYEKPEKYLDNIDTEEKGIIEGIKELRKKLLKN